MKCVYLISLGVGIVNFKFGEYGHVISDKFSG